MPNYRDGLLCRLRRSLNTCHQRRSQCILHSKGQQQKRDANSNLQLLVQQIGYSHANFLVEANTSCSIRRVSDICCEKLKLPRSNFFRLYMDGKVLDMAHTLAYYGFVAWSTLEFHCLLPGGMLEPSMFNSECDYSSEISSDAVDIDEENDGGKSDDGLERETEPEVQEQHKICDNVRISNKALSLIGSSRSLESVPVDLLTFLVSKMETNSFDIPTLNTDSGQATATVDKQFSTPSLGLDDGCGQPGVQKDHCHIFDQHFDRMTLLGAENNDDDTCEKKFSQKTGLITKSLQKLIELVRSKCNANKIPIRIQIETPRAVKSDKWFSGVPIKVNFQCSASCTSTSGDDATATRKKEPCTFGARYEFCYNNAKSGDACDILWRIISCERGRMQADGTTLMSSQTSCHSCNPAQRLKTFKANCSQQTISNEIESAVLFLSSKGLIADDIANIINKFFLTKESSSDGDDSSPSPFTKDRIYRIIHRSKSCAAGDSQATIDYLEKGIMDGSIAFYAAKKDLSGEIIRLLWITTAQLWFWLCGQGDVVSVDTTHGILVGNRTQLGALMTRNPCASRDGENTLVSLACFFIRESVAGVQVIKHCLMTFFG